MPNRRLVAKHLGELMRVLSHPDRIQIVQLLAASGEHRVSNIAETLSLPATRISQHLATLKAHRLVEERTEGRHRFYRLTVKQLAPWLVSGVDFVIDRFGNVSREQGEDAKRLWVEEFEHEEI
ncbi:MAG: metalloregulator ArsR/SmtB family transcription factor [Pseudomonadota bacterium]